MYRPAWNYILRFLNYLALLPFLEGGACSFVSMLMFVNKPNGYSCNFGNDTAPDISSQLVHVIRFLFAWNSLSFSFPLMFTFGTFDFELDRLAPQKISIHLSI